MAASERGGRENGDLDVRASARASGHFKLSLGRSSSRCHAYSAPGADDEHDEAAHAFLPSSEDLERAMSLLDYCGDGRVSEGHVEALLLLSFGKKWVEGSDSWQRLKERNDSEDGKVTLTAALAAIEQTVAVVKKENSDRELHSEKATEGGRPGKPPPVAKKGKALSSRAPVRSKGGLGSSFNTLTEYVEAFVKFDVDLDGFVRSNDLKVALERMAVGSVTFEHCEELLRQLDTRALGAVGLMEFNALMQLLKDGDLI